MWGHTASFSNLEKQNAFVKGGISTLDKVIYVSMETGLDPITLINMPVTVLKRISDGIGNIYQEKNRIQDEFYKDRKARGN